MGRKSRSRLAADWFAKLRINAQTQEVEHEDVSDVKEEMDTSVSSDLAALDSDKADATYVASEMAKLDSEKADLSYVNTAIANATMADSDILSAVKRVDGSGSGLDADTLDGYSYKAFNSSALVYHTTGSASRYKIRLPFSTSSSRMLKFTISMYQSYTQHDYEVSGYFYAAINQWYSPQVVYKGTGTPDIKVGRDSDGRAYVSVAGGSYSGIRVHSVTLGHAGSDADAYNQDWSIASTTDVSNSITPAIYKIWTSGNDGSGSGLDADTLDGIHASSFLADSGKSFATNGYQKLSNGLIIQWGRSSASGGRTISFPIAFPNACLNVVASAYEYRVYRYGVATWSLNKNSFYAYLNSTASWHAIGY